MSDIANWDERYVAGETPWDTGTPSTELQRVLRERGIRAPGRALEFGCGTGTNSIWLAGQGWDVTAIDFSAQAIERARGRPEANALPIRFLQADVLSLPALPASFDFFFDRGCYHAVRRADPLAYPAALRKVPFTKEALGLVLAGNAREPNEPGPPVVTEEQIRAELGAFFPIMELREFRFDASPGCDVRFLGWSCLLRMSP